MFLKALYVTLYRVFYISKRLVVRIALRDATGESRAFDDKFAVFVLFYYHAVFHRA